MTGSVPRRAECRCNAGATDLKEEFASVSSPAVFDATLRGHNLGLLHADHDAQGRASATVTADRFVDAHHGARWQRRARD